ncbi:ROK family transcriptional regulator [Serinicoccus kebangsaanensis]|uniref:ROK family transcriptional regulator n=1 Tax=Serinicoccus kebangsaanensis TaxID=2602069 RepID=UPI00124F6915|nr:ROK family transcriptional regulator [Serinicoccus kebangsaanensis]
MDALDRRAPALLATLGVRGPQSRTQLARGLGLSPATVTQLTRQLLTAGVIGEVDSVPSRGGRPATLLALTNRRAGAIGVKVSPSRITVVPVQMDGAVGERTVAEFDPGAPEALEVLADTIATQVQEFDGVLLGVGVGLPGAVDDQARGVVDAPTLGWSGMAVGDYLRRTLPQPVPVLLDNDVNTLAVAEHMYGEAGRHPSPLIVTIGHGIGCAIVAGGRLHRGFRGGAGELGHVPVALDGPECRCGNRGCLEALVGDDALAQRARERGIVGPQEGKSELNDRALGGHPGAIQLFEEAGTLLGRTLAGLAQVVDPDVLVILGEGTDVWELWRPSFTMALRRHLLPDRRSIPIVMEDWPDDRWAAGAASLVLFSPFDTDGLGGDQGELVRTRLHRGLTEAVEA